MKSKYKDFNIRIINIPGIISGLFVSYMITLVFFIIYALALTFTSLSELTLPILTMLITIVGIVISGALAARNTTSKGWLNGGIAGLLYSIIMILLAGFFIKELGPASTWIYKLMWGMILGALGGMIGINL
ncbi:TIGR04086 family membrane protein [Aceticella autotrophica]|uniref:TIGR04086 family membrane protein n=1 Tax=Aceticella autotrophica TaxID=2755338 RepID=A0A975AUK6_9THEO|nr:TIGR04086 family membrane protein [Aceticella autotrophica]QSZ26729.1 TIGR04086 family membrane protein [Aceticella autotrophica]